MDETTECVRIHDTDAKCNFYLNTQSCHGSDGKLDYMFFIFCHLQPESAWGGIALCVIWLLLLFIGLGVTADDFKTGVTFLAFGNGAPDIFSSVAGTEQGRPELVIGTLFGAGIFVTSVVAGSIIASKPFKIMERPFLRDIIFYVCAAFWTFLRFYYGEVTLLHSIGFSFRGSISVSNTKKRHSSVHSHHEHVIKAITQSIQSHSNPAFTNGYPPPLDTQISKTSLSSLLSSTGEQTLLREFLMHVFPIDLESWQERKWLSKIFELIKAPICCLLILTVPVVDYENDKNNWCRPLNIIHIYTAPMFVIFALDKYDVTLEGFPIWAILLIVSTGVAIAVFCSSNNSEPPIYHCLYGYFGFATSVIWVYLIASEIVSLLQTIGVVFKLSDTILGLTVLAWGNSIGDLLLGIGIPYTVIIAKNGRPLKLKYEKLVTLLYSTLTVILLFTIVTMTFLRFQAKRPFGIILISLEGCLGVRFGVCFGGRRLFLKGITGDWFCVTFLKGVRADAWYTSKARISPFNLSNELISNSLSQPSKNPLKATAKVNFELKLIVSDSQAVQICRISMDEAKEVHKCLRKAAGIFSAMQEKYIGSLLLKTEPASDLDSSVVNAYISQCTAEAQEVTIARAIELKHAPSLISALANETSRMYSAGGYATANKLSKEYVTLKGPGVSAKPDNHLFFRKLGPIIKRILEKCERENGFIFHQKIPAEPVPLEIKATYGLVSPEEFLLPSINSLWTPVAYAAFDSSKHNPNDAAHSKSAMKAEGDLPPVKEATFHQSAQDPKNTSGCVLQNPYP
ncbi:Mitochondrial sodium/calcium exchanger protein like [Argiope bruennichi]|uniref:Mitochondrial sodium/calcium exchanger protein like n=1 Tax=Argiope bruennichi TaxID=94029 RepID=A0A8T0F2U8_ARGBR|nr:Mitochondrial sodium/calcium exchanger protein like [Argiope bruennichi]